ncbi:MAG: DUF1465 family protein [Sphingobium sp.]
MLVADSINPAFFNHMVDSLYVEAMVMADEARGYFDRQGDADRAHMDMMARLSFTCESLKVTTRLMHIIAWLLTRRAWQRGEISWEALCDPKYNLGDAAATDRAIGDALPESARALIRGSEDLYARILRLQNNMRPEGGAIPSSRNSNPAHSLMDRLEQAF